MSTFSTAIREGWDRICRFADWIRIKLLISLMIIAGIAMSFGGAGAFGARWKEPGVTGGGIVLILFAIALMVLFTNLQRIAQRALSGDY